MTSTGTQTSSSTLDLSRLLERVPSPAVLVDGQRHLVGANRSYRLRHPEVDRFIGRTCYAVSHGLTDPCVFPTRSCPIHECFFDSQPSRQVHLHRSAEERNLVEVVSLPIGGYSKSSYLVLQMFRNLAQAPTMPPGRLMGRSKVMRDLMHRLDRRRTWRMPVLVRGEAGTERELVARALHSKRPRRKGPFVSIPCGGIESSAIHELLDGTQNPKLPYSRLAEAAAGGTIFLDDLPSLANDLQEELLISLTSRSSPWSRQSGSGDEAPRWVLGMSETLEMAVASERLLPELQEWLHRVEVVVPPLRERRVDIPLLVAAIRPWLVAPPELEVDPGVAHALAPLPLFGNLWELRERLQQGVLNAGRGPVLAEHLVWESPTLPC